MFAYEQWANHLTAILVWHVTSNLSPGTRATLLSPTSPISRRAAVVWLLLAPSIMVISWQYLPRAAPTFGLITTFMVWYHRKHVETLNIPEDTPQQKKSDVHTIINQVCGLGHGDLWRVVIRAQRQMADLPLNKDQKAAMVQVLEAQKAYMKLCGESEHDTISDIRNPLLAAHFDCLHLGGDPRYKRDISRSASCPAPLRRNKNSLY